VAITSNGLANVGLGAGLTTNFQVQYESTLPNQANVIANCNALLAVLENEFIVTTGWFNTPAGKFGAGNRQVVNLNLPDGSGANNTGYGRAINQDAQSGNNNAVNAAGIVQMIFMNEWVEILMSLSGGKWNAGDSSGEGLSQYCGIVRFQTGHYSYYVSWVNQWLNALPRQDWVNNTQGTDKNAVSFGCALGFLFYLNTQLNFSINQIIAAGSSNLATVYRNLTGDTRDPFQRFSGLLALYFPTNQTSNLINDNPFPLSEEQQHIFYRGADGGINHIFWDAPSKRLFRDQWTQLTDAPGAIGDPATMVWPNQQHIFYRGAEGAIDHIFWDAPSNRLFRDQWTQLTGAPGAIGDPATMVWPNQQHIFYRGADGAINHIFWDAPSNRLFRDQWTQLTGAPGAIGDPATMVWPKQQHIFYRGADGAINHIFWDAPSNRLFRDQWTQLTGAPAAAGDPATMVWPGQQHIFYRGLDGAINHIFWDAASNRLFHDQWTQLTGAPAAADDPVTMVWPNQQHIFYRGADGAINHIFWDAPGNRLFRDQWTQLTGAPSAIGDPATMVWPNQQHIFYRGADRAINHIFWDAPSNRLFRDQWTQLTGAPVAAGDPATMIWHLVDGN
jgi:hypothetical protein